MIIVGNGALVLLLQIEQASDGEIHSLHIVCRQCLHSVLNLWWPGPTPRQQSFCSRVTQKMYTLYSPEQKLSPKIFM